MLPLAITMGCPVGIGPEIILKYFHEHRPLPPTVVIGDPAVLVRTGQQLGLPSPTTTWLPGQKIDPDTIAVYTPPRQTPLSSLRWGKPTNNTGQAMGEWIEAAVHLCQQGSLAGMTTCPITKTALNAGGYHFPGHTEMLAQLCQTNKFAMMMAGNKLRVTLVTIHMALAQVAAHITTTKVTEMIDITWQSLNNDFGLTAPRLAVAALNPHGGEGTMFGDEEERIINPAIQNARAKGLDVQGPFPPDTIFHKAANGAYDAVVCMYHDQGLIPFKLLHFSDGVNITLGLPIVRTSVDHGTAYDIAGQGVADPTSLVAACGLAQEIIQHRQKV